MDKLQTGKYFHIYNRGNNLEDLFRIPENYKHFLRLYEKYIVPVAETYAWVLMKNHFHLAVRVREEADLYKTLNSKDLTGFQNLSGLMKKDEIKSIEKLSDQKNDPATQAFSNLFNAYSKGINKMFSRTGTLFQRPFHRKLVTSEEYLQQLIIYIHHNPEHHGFVEDFRDYPWSSYNSIISTKPTKLARDKVLDWFENKANFIEVHKRKVDEKLIYDIIIE